MAQGLWNVGGAVAFFAILRDLNPEINRNPRT
jgi:hypothetical protein